VLGDGHLIAGGFDGFEDLRCAAPFVAQQDDKKRASLCALLQPGEQHRQRDDSDHEDWEERQRIPRGPGRPERQVRILCPPRSGRQGVLCTGDLESSPRDLGSLRIVCLVFASYRYLTKTDTRYERGWRGRRVGETGVTFSGEFGRGLAGTSSGVADSGRWSAAGRGSPPRRSPGRPPIVLVSRCGSSRSRSVNRPATTAVCRPAPENRRVDAAANRRHSSHRCPSRRLGWS
jgi:hypothetical protein